MTKEQLTERRLRIRTLDRLLKKLYPKAGIELIYGSPWELLVAVQLSAQCTDKRVNLVTAKLFKKYKTLAEYVAADPAVFEQDIRSCGYFRAKTKNILAAARMIHTTFGGAVPRTMEEMLRLPGVGRKTATVVLATAYGVVSGITVDTHIIRFVQRFGLSDFKDAVRIERDLMQILPKKEWTTFTHRVIHYGRYLAPARRYDVSVDPLVRAYPPAGTRFRT